MTDIELVIPVDIERATLEASVRRLHAFLAHGWFPFSSRITIADNASTDGTIVVARRLSYELDGVEVIQLISRAYNRILRVAVGARFSDAQCGFKAVRSDVARTLLPLVRDEEWFFDTELLVLAQRRCLRIHEVPVDWVEDLDSRVSIVPTALADLRGVARLMLHRERRALTLLSPTPRMLPDR